MSDVNNEPRFKPGTDEYDADVIKRARKAAITIGKTLEHYRLIGEALSIMRRRAMEAAGMKGTNKQPAGPKYTKALNEELDKAPEFLSPEVFESGSARTHAVWLHESAADVEWTFQVMERAKPGSTRRWNNPTYIWKQWRKLTKEPTKRALDAKAAKEAKVKAQQDELERYREEWKLKYEALVKEVEERGWTAARETIDAAEPPKRTRKAKAQEAGGYGPGVLEQITGKPKRERKPKAKEKTDENPNMV